MENNNINIKTLSLNLLINNDFISAIKFEADYASVVKGGHLPYYYTAEKKRRLVDSVNLLSPAEQQEIVYSLFTGKN